MTEHNRNIDIIRHMLKYCEQIEETLTFIDFEREKFINNHIYINACSLCILQIGELAKHLTKEFTEAFPEIPWRMICGMRDRFAHDYINTDDAILWETVTKDIVELRCFCERLLKQYQTLREESIRHPE